MYSIILTPRCSTASFARTRMFILVDCSGSGHECGFLSCSAMRLLSVVRLSDRHSLPVPVARNGSSCEMNSGPFGSIPTL